MNKKGFTLIELLAVIVILTMLGVFTVSIILDKMDQTNLKIDEATEDLIITATQNYVAKYQENYSKKSGNVYCIGINEILESEGITDESAKTESSISSLKGYIKVSFSQNSVSYNVVEACAANAEIIPNKPLLLSNMIPIKWDNNNNIVVADTTSSDWYDYLEGRWANAMIVPQTKLSKYKSLKPGDLVIPFNEIEDEVIFVVWIPRFKYSLNLGDKLTADIVFESGITSTGTTHTAFKNGTAEISGFWVSKYELTTLNVNSSNNKINSSFNQKPYQTTYVEMNNQINSLYTSSYNFLQAETTIKMIANKEWSAISYLAHSKYGLKNQEVYASDVYTGTIKKYVVGNLIKEKGIISISYNINSPSNYTNEIYYSEDSVFTSTTRNVTGVYGMNGGANEWVLKPDLESALVSGLTEEARKSILEYILSNNNEALLKAKGSYNSASVDLSNIISDGYCLLRGGSTTNNGIFAYALDYCASTNAGTRIVLK